MKTEHGIEIAEKTKTPMREAVEYFESTIEDIEDSLNEGDTTFTEEELLSTKIHLNFLKCLLEEEKELITQAYEDGNRDGKDGEFNSGYFELNFES